MELIELQDLVFQEYKKNGYLKEWTVSENYSNIQRKVDLAEIGLFNTEVAELQEEIRKKDYIFYDLGIECADIIIRVLNFMSRKHLDAEMFIKAKHEKNLKRGKLHGKQI